MLPTAPPPALSVLLGLVTTLLAVPAALLALPGRPSAKLAHQEEHVRLVQTASVLPATPTTAVLFAISVHQITHFGTVHRGTAGVLVQGTTTLAPVAPHPTLLAQLELITQLLMLVTASHALPARPL